MLPVVVFMFIVQAIMDYFAGKQENIHAQRKAPHGPHDTRESTADDVQPHNDNKAKVD